MAPPPWKHFDVQLEVNRAVEQRCDLGAGRLAQRLDRAPPFPNDDALLTVPLDVHHRPNIYRLRALPELVDCDRDRVGQLLVQQLERRLAHELRREEAHGRSEEHTSELQSQSNL